MKPVWIMIAGPNRSGASAGTDREVERFRARGRPVHASAGEIPEAR